MRVPPCFAALTHNSPRPTTGRPRPRASGRTSATLTDCAASRAALASERLCLHHALQCSRRPDSANCISAGGGGGVRETDVDAVLFRAPLELRDRAWPSWTRLRSCPCDFSVLRSRIMESEQKRFKFVPLRVDATVTCEIRGTGDARQRLCRQQAHGK